MQNLKNSGLKIMGKLSLVQLSCFSVLVFGMAVNPSAEQIGLILFCLFFMTAIHVLHYICSDFFQKDNPQDEVIEKLDYIKSQMSSLGISKIGR